MIETRNKIRITDMNMDCIILIHEELSFVDMLSMAKANPAFVFAAANIFRRKYSKRTVQIVTPFEETGPIKMNVFDDLIYIVQFETAKSILNLFGPLIINLEIYQHSEQISGDKDVLLIINLLNLHCSGTIKRLQLTAVYEENFFVHMKKPFKQLESLSIKKGHLTTLNSNLDLSELFPVIKFLELGYLRIHDETCIEQTFRHLEHLSIRINKKCDKFKFFDEANIKRLIQKNPTIQHLTLDYSNRAFLRFISENMKQLNALTLVCYDDRSENDQQEIVFEHVKQFSTIACYFNSVPNNLRFKSLEIFRPDHNPDAVHSWLDFVARHTHLKKLYVKGRPLGDKMLQNLTSIVPNLIEIFARLDDDVKDETIVNFVQINKQHMQRFDWMRYIKRFTSTSERLLEMIGSEWDVNEVGVFYLTLSRK